MAVYPAYPHPPSAGVKPRLVRYRDHALVRWEPAAPAEARWTGLDLEGRAAKGEARSETATATLRLDGLAAGGAQVELALTDAGGVARSLPPLESTTATLQALTQQLRGLLKGRTNDEVTRAFNDSFRDKASGKVKIEERFPAPAAGVKKARRESGLDGVLAARDPALVRSILEQACPLLDAQGPWVHKAALFREAHELANLDAYCLNDNVSVAAEALRFLFAMRPDSLRETSKIPGSSNYERKLWRCVPLQTPQAVKDHLDRLRSKEGPYFRTLNFSEWIDSQPEARADMLATVTQTKGHMLPVEFVQESKAVMLEAVMLPVKLESRLFRPLPPKAAPAMGELAIHTVIGPRLHVDIRRDDGFLMCLRPPPGPGDKHGKFAGVISFSCDPAALYGPGGAVTFTVHCARGDGDHTKEFAEIHPWMSRIVSLVVRWL